MTKKRWQKWMLKFGVKNASEQKNLKLPTLKMESHGII